MDRGDTICSDPEAVPAGATVGSCPSAKHAKTQQYKSKSQHTRSAVQGDLGRDAGRRLLRELEADGGWDAVYALYSGSLEPSSLVRGSVSGLLHVPPISESVASPARLFGLL